MKRLFSLGIRFIPYLRMRWPIRYQLLVPLVTLLLGVVGITTWTALASAQRARHQIETQVRNVAHTLSTSPHVPLSQKMVLEQMKGLSGADYLLCTGDGQQLTTLPTNPPHLPSVEAVVENWKNLQLGPRVNVAGQTYLGSGVRLPPRADIPAGAILYILYPEELWKNALWEAIHPSLFLGGFAGLASVVLAVGVGRRFSRRVQELERRTRLLAAGDFRPMPLSGRNDELRDLSRSVNEMAQQLAQLQETVRKTERLRLLGQVSGGLAHQLRNGITGARLAVQLHARACADRGDAEALDVALRQLALLEAHLKRFLGVGRENGQVRHEACSVVHLVDEIVMLLRPQCRHAHIELLWQVPAADRPILGDRGQLEQLILNILSNGMEAAGPGGSVAVSIHYDALRVNKATEWKLMGPMSTTATNRPIASHLEMEGQKPPVQVAEEIAFDTLVLEIEDSGPGPLPEVAGRLFEPFVTAKPEGVGLGLAVARQVAESHGGKISWCREQERTVFRVELPLAT